MSFSIYIPYVFSNIKHNRIADTFVMNGYGIVEKIDFVSKMNTNGKCYNSAYVHFSHWYDNETATQFKNTIEDPELQALLIYDNPWYWIILPNTGKIGSRKKCLDIGDLDQASSLEKEH